MLLIKGGDFKMDDVLAHHGILGQKWGVRRFQDTDGSLTRAGKQRYGVGEKKKNNWKENLKNERKAREPKQGTVDQYKDLYNKQVKLLTKVYENSKDEKGNVNFNSKKELLEILKNAESLIASHSGDSNNPGAVTGGTEREQWNEALKTIGLESNVNLHQLGMNILNSSGSDLDAAYDEAIKYLAAYQAAQQMGNYHWLPSEVEEREKEEKIRKEIEEMNKSLNDAGLSGIVQVNKSYKVSDPDTPILEYAIELDGKNYFFKKDEIEKMQRFAIQHKLFDKDFRTTSSGQRTREKNVNTSAGAKAVKKREKLDISDEERSKKESNSKASTEAQVKKNAEMLNAILLAQKRTQASIKQDKAKKKSVSHMEEDMNDTLVHYGVLGMKWGIRRYQNEDGTLTDAGKKRYYRSVNKLHRIDTKLQKNNTKKNKFDEKVRKAEYQAVKPKRLLQSWDSYEKSQLKRESKLANVERKYKKFDWKAEKYYNKGSKWVMKMNKKFSDVNLSDIDQNEIKYVDSYLESVLKDRRRSSHT